MSSTSNPPHSQRIGKWGEGIAQTYLTQKGYQVLATRYRTPYGEIDIIATVQNVLVFVEVKTRRSREAFSVSLTPQQYNRAYQTAEYFISTRDDINLLETRFDAIMVDQDGVREHIEGIWEMEPASHT